MLNNRPLYILNPRIFTWLVNAGHLQGNIARSVLQAILSIIQLYRIKTTKVRMDSKISRIGNTISMYSIGTVE